MNPQLDPGLVAVALIAILAIIAVCLWLVAAGHLDHIEEDASLSPAERDRTGDAPYARRVSPSSREAIRAELAAWGAHGTHWSVRSTGGVRRNPEGAPSSTRHREVRSAQARPNPHRDR